MDYKVVMPRLSDAMEEGQLVEWKIRPGQQVKSGDVIAEVESDKAVMEIQTFKSGVVKKLLIDAGTTVPVGTEMAVIEVGGDASPGRKKAEGEKEERPAEKQHPESGTRSPEPGKHSPENEARNMESGLRNPEHRTRSTEPGARNPEHGVRNPEPAVASPKARALAAKYGIDIEALQKEGSLPVPAHSEDVERWRLRRYFTPKALAAIGRYHLDTALFGTEKKHDEAEILAYVRAHGIPLPEPLDANRKAMIATVTAAAKKPVYHMSDVLDAALLKRCETSKLTVTVWLLKLFAEAMMRHEAFRTTLGPQGLQRWPGASVALAVADGERLYMPVLGSLETRTPEQIADALAEIKAKVRGRRITAEEMTGSTFGLSNLGMTGIAQFDAMIHGDDCAIAAVGAERDGKISVTLTVDHRIVNGYQAAQFMNELKTLARDERFFTEAGQ